MTDFLAKRTQLVNYFENPLSWNQTPAIRDSPKNFQGEHWVRESPFSEHVLAAGTQAYVQEGISYRYELCSGFRIWGLELHHLP